LKNLGLECHALLDFEMFERVANHPTRMEEHVRAIPLHKLFADAFADGEAEPVLFFARLTEVDIKSVVQGVAEGLERLLAQHVERSRQVLEASKRKVVEPWDLSKFQVAPMSCGRIEDFHAGLSRRIGELLLLLQALFCESGWSNVTEKATAEVWRPLTCMTPALFG
jgi:hypothetical protein